MKKYISFASVAILLFCVVGFLSSYKPQGNSNPYLMMKVSEGRAVVGGSNIFIVDEIGRLEEVKLSKAAGGSGSDNMSTIVYQINKLNELGYDLRSNSMSTDPAGTMVQVYMFQKR